MEIHEALRAARAAQGFSFAQIAAIAGSGEASARRWEAGTTRIFGTQLMALRRGLPGFADLLDGRATIENGQVVLGAQQVAV